MDPSKSSPPMTAAESADTVTWDVECNRPIVDGKIAHPVTGEIQEAGGQGFTYGPPGITLRIINTNSNVNFWASFGNVDVSLEKVYLQIARHVHDGIYTLDSITATPYSFTIICQIQVSLEEFDIAWKNKFQLSSEYKYTDEEWDAWQMERTRQRIAGMRQVE